MNNHSLLWNRKFWPLCYTQFFGAFNDNFFKNALIILITFQSMNLIGLNTEQLIALCGGIFIFPFFLFSALAGQIADKHEKSKLIIYIKVLELFIMTLAVAGFITKSLFILLIALFLMGLQSSLFSPLKYSYIPHQVPPYKLVEANALLQSSTFLAILIGTIFGGLIIAIPEMGSFYVSLGVISLAIIGFLFSLFITQVPPVAPNLPFKYNPFTSTWSLIHYIIQKKHVLWTILGLAWFWFYGATLLSILPGYGKKILGGNEQVVTFLLTLFSIGIGLGCMICKKISRQKLKLGLAPVGALGLSLFLLDLSFQSYFMEPGATESFSFFDFIKNPKNFRIIFDLSMIAFSGGLFFVPLMTFLQKISPKKNLSRIIAGGNIFDAFFMVIAAIIIIILFSIGLNEIEIFIFLALLNLIVTGYIYKISKVFSKIEQTDSSVA